MKTFNMPWTWFVIGFLTLSASLFGCSGGSGDTAGMIDTTTQSAAVTTPTFSPVAKIYSNDQSVTINSSTAGATIYYTTDGSTPTTSSAVFGSPIAVAGNGTTMTIKAMAVSQGMTNSVVASATYTIINSQVVATPTFFVPAGTYSTDQSVMINSSTAGATIYYTTDGSTPTTSSAVFSSPIAVAGNGTTMMIKAMAVSSGMTNSAVASATYVISTTAVIFSYPPNSSGGLIQSSWVAPNGSDQDMYAYKDFTLASTQSIREIDWRGGYMLNAPYGHVSGFTVTIFESIAGGSQPHVTTPDTQEIYLAKYTVAGNAGETLAGVVGGTTMYDYKSVLPIPFQAVAGTKYWLRIEASQNTFPDWGIAVGAGGNGNYFRFSTCLAMFTMIAGGDTAFALLK